MIKRIKNLLLVGDSAPEAKPEDERQAVIAALLVQGAMMDGDFAESERATIEHILVADFGLEASDVSDLIDAAVSAVEVSSQLFGFTKTAREHLDHNERILLIEMLWRVVYADGEVHEYETSLMRRITGLLSVTDRESAFARQRATGQ